MVVHMTLNVKHKEADKLARALSHLTGQSITSVIITALKEKLVREQGKKLPASLKDKIIEIGRRCSELPDLDKRTPDQIIGYDRHGSLESDNKTNLNQPRHMER